MAVDAYMEVIVNKVSKDDTIPTSNYTYSYYNQEGGSMSTVSSDVNVGTGANIVEVMNSNNQVLESFKTGVVDKLNAINVTIGTNGVKVNGVDNIVQEIKTMGQNSVNEMIKNTTQLANVKTAIQNQELSPTINNNVDTPSVTVQAPSITNEVDVSSIANETSKIATATEIIATGVTDQIETNKKIIEKTDLQIDDLTFNKTANKNLTDLEGNQMSPRDVAALKNAEVAKETKDMNDTTIDDLFSFTADMFNFGAETVSDTLGLEDGLTADFNPLKFIFDEMEKDIEAELNKEQGAT